MSSLYLPEAKGYLPYWMLFVSGLAIFNSLQNYATTSLTRRLYSRSPASVTTLQARTFAIWTLTNAAIRIYAAYHISNKAVYDLALWSYVFAAGHFWSELLVFRTAGLGAGVLSPIIVAGTSLVWMVNQYDFYVSK